MTHCKAWNTAAGAPNLQSMSQTGDVLTCVEEPMIESTLSPALWATVTATWTDHSTLSHDRHGDADLDSITLRAYH